ncbi:MAG: hypothetical protein FWD53_04975, partial [Phycisphaerales bacterium]|nr:hypothetical protein [Phycisphaerales bacterium]
MIDDCELLQRWTTQRDELAFGELVSRHVGMVYRAATRMLRGKREAEDVTQAVFLLLTQRAKKIKQMGSLAGWLYQATVYCARNMRKGEGRR